MSAPVIILIGCPGSGKTTYATTHLSDHFRIDGDIYKTAPAMIRIANTCSDTQSIVFDSTGVTKERRQAYVNWAKSKNRPVKYIWINTPFENCLTQNKSRAHPVPAVALYTFRKRFEPPSLEEETIDELQIITP